MDNLFSASTFKSDIIIQLQILEKAIQKFPHEAFTSINFFCEKEKVYSIIEDETKKNEDTVDMIFIIEGKTLFINCATTFFYVKSDLNETLVQFLADIYSLFQFRNIQILEKNEYGKYFIIPLFQIKVHKILRRNQLKYISTELNKHLVFTDNQKSLTLAILKHYMESHFISQVSYDLLVHIFFTNNTYFFSTYEPMIFDIAFQEYNDFRQILYLINTKDNIYFSKNTTHSCFAPQFQPAFLHITDIQYATFCDKTKNSIIFIPLSTSNFENEPFFEIKLDEFFTYNLLNKLDYIVKSNLLHFELSEHFTFLDDFVDTRLKESQKIKVEKKMVISFPILKIKGI